MSNIHNFNGFGFIVDTDKYSGNFEREMCAYLTGEIGECGVGHELVEPLPINFSNVINLSDEHGCYRPVEIYPTEGYFNHGMGGNFKHGEEELAVIDYRKKCIEYGESVLKTYSHNLEYGQKRQKQWIDESNNITVDTLQKHPSYQSVCIFFNTKPTDEQISFMKERVNGFVEKMRSYRSYRSNFTLNILGFRLIEFKTVTNIINV